MRTERYGEVNESLAGVSEEGEDNVENLAAVWMRFQCLYLCAAQDLDK